MREELNKYKSGMMKDNGEDEGIMADDVEGGAGAHSESDGETVKQVKRVNGTVDPEVMELRRQIEKQSNDLGSSHRTISELRAKNTELDERIIQLNKELHGAQEFAKNLDIDLKENVAQKEDQVKTIFCRTMTFNDLVLSPALQSVVQNMKSQIVMLVGK